MKKGILTFVLLFLSTTIFAQDIINTVGPAVGQEPSGEFQVRESGGTGKLLRISENPDLANDPIVKIGIFDMIPMFGDPRIQVRINASTPQINLNSTTNWAPSSGVLNFSRKYGAAIVRNTDKLGSIVFRGYAGYIDGTKVSAEISSTVASTVVDGDHYVPANIEFKTSPGGSTDMSTRMTIGHDGIINIPKLDIDLTAYVLVDAQGNLYSSGTAPTSPAHDGGEELTKRLDDLEKENIELKREISEIKSLLER